MKIPGSATGDTATRSDNFFVLKQMHCISTYGYLLTAVTLVIFLCLKQPLYLLGRNLLKAIYDLFFQCLPM